MQLPFPNEYNPAYQHYFDGVAAGNYLDLLKQDTKDTIAFFEAISFEKHNYQYAAGKWSIKELLLHIIDTERVFSTRALMAARGDSENPVPRMDEELYARNAPVTGRTMQSLVEEFAIVRRSTTVLFENITEEQAVMTCNITPHPMTTRAIGYFIIGHAIHHVNIIKERYLHQ